MIKYNLPKIKLRKPEKIWLECVYKHIRNGERPTYRMIRSELINKIPINFNPKEIDNTIANYKGQELTLLGIDHIDPNFKILEKTNSVVKSIRTLILNNPNLKTIESEKISELTKIDNKTIMLILSLFSRFGRFYNSAGRSGEGYGYNHLSLFRDDSENDEMVYNQYLHFESIEKLIHIYFEEQNEKSNTKKIEKNISDTITIKPENDSEIIVNPIFSTRINQVDYKLCFVLMPFTKNWSDRVYKNFIRTNIEDLGLQCLRADNLTGQIIIEDIWTKINQAAFLIADVTDKNPNVMYELGIAHTLGKPVILITQDTSSIPFDFKHLRHYVYEDNSDGIKIFQSKLKQVIKNLYIEFYPNLDIKI